MGITIKFLGEIQPICNDCGIALCWTIDEYEYNKYSEFWNNWKCEICDPNYKYIYKTLKND